MEIRQRCLLIGNSRWHWADRASDGVWRYTHSQPMPQALDSGAPLTAWAGVGPVSHRSLLRNDRRLDLDQIPLRDVPPWLGIDRALAGWGAWRQSGQTGAVMAVDAGTVLSLTRVTGDGRFDGGWLSAGLRLQLQAMARGTEALTEPRDTFADVWHAARFPRDTGDAMHRGVLESLLGLIVSAQAQDPVPLWLCGGDAPSLLPALLDRGIEVSHAPDLVMQSMVAVVS